MNQNNPYFKRQAEEHFKQARKQAQRARLRGWLSGKSAQGLSFEAIQEALQARNPHFIGRKYISVDKVAGSVGRCDDFTREFLPLKSNLRERWVRVEAYAHEHGWPPIEVYQIGDVYFVIDGNHRIAVSKQIGIDTIEANVYAFDQELEIHPDESMDTLLIRLGEKNFMQQTHLDVLMPDHALQFTTPGRHKEMLTQIETLRQHLTQIDGEEMRWEDAVLAWYEMMYLTTAQVIRDEKLLENFQGRTEADLFAWLWANRHAMPDAYGEYKTVPELVRRIAERHRESALGRATRKMQNLLGGEQPASLEDLD